MNNNTEGFSEKFPLYIVIAMMVLILSVMFHHIYTWPAAYTRNKIADAQYLQGTVMSIGQLESYHWYYHYSTYDKRRDKSHDPSVGVVQWPEDNSVSIRLNVYPVQLDGKNQGYVGFVTRSSSITVGTRVTCGMGRVYYPKTGRSQFAFWLECQSENNKIQFKPVHQCEIYNSHYILISCPDDYSYDWRKVISW